MKRLCAILALMCLLASAWASAASMELECYYIDPCGGCKSVKEGGCGKCYVENGLNKRLQPLLRALPADRQVVLRMKNLSLYPEKYDPLLERAEQLGVKPEDFSLPCLFIGDALFAGDGSQDDDLLRFITSGGSDYSGYAAPAREDGAPDANAARRRAIYLYSPWCEDCKSVERYLRSYFPKDAVLEKYSIAEEDGLLLQQALIRRYGIAEDAFFVPFIVYGEEYFLGKADICLSLISRMQEFPDAVTPSMQELLAQEGETAPTDP